jgi:ParB/RepB/Spo0J family partition protein
VVTRDHGPGSPGAAPRPGAAGVATRLPRTRAWERLIANPAGVDDFYGVKLISRALLDPNPDQPRRGELRGIEELAGSIREYGLLQPIVVAPPASGRYVIQAGHRRKAAYDWLFAHDAEPERWAQVPALVKDAPTADRLVLALVENLAREGLSDAEILAALGVLRDLHQWSQAEIARRLGVSRAWITQYFRVAGDAEVSAHVQTGGVSVAKGYDVVKAATAEARERALAAALRGADLRTIRGLAKPSPGGVLSHLTPRPRPGDAPRDESDGGSGDEQDEQAGGREAAPAGAPGGGEEATSATAAPVAGVHDLADLAGELGLTLDLRELELMRLFRAAIRTQTPRAGLADFIRAARADLRRAEALVRSAPRAARPPAP